MYQHLVSNLVTYLGTCRSRYYTGTAYGTVTAVLGKNCHNPWNELSLGVYGKREVSQLTISRSMMTGVGPGESKTVTSEEKEAEMKELVARFHRGVKNVKTLKARLAAVSSAWGRSVPWGGV